MRSALPYPLLSFSSCQSYTALFLCAEENPDEEHGRDRDVCEVVYEEVTEHIPFVIVIHLLLLDKDIALCLTHFNSTPRHTSYL